MQGIIVLLLIAVIALVLYIMLLRIDIDVLRLSNKMKITQCTVDVKHITLTDVVVDGKLIKPYRESAFLWYILANASFETTVEEMQEGLMRGSGYFISYSDLKILMDILEKENINPDELL